MQALKKRIVSLMREKADDIEVGNSHLTDTEAMDLLHVLAHREMSKEEACVYMNERRSNFDRLVREGVIPKGKKVAGFKELRWYEDELDGALWRKNRNKP